MNMKIKDFMEWCNRSDSVVKSVEFQETIDEDEGINCWYAEVSRGDSDNGFYFENLESVHSWIEVNFGEKDAKVDEQDERFYDFHINPEGGGGLMVSVSRSLELLFLLLFTCGDVVPQEEYDE